MTTTTNDRAGQPYRKLTWDEIKVLHALPTVFEASPGIGRDLVIRDMAGLSPTRFWQIAVKLADDPPPRLRLPIVHALRQVKSMLETSRRRRADGSTKSEVPVESEQVDGDGGGRSRGSRGGGRFHRPG